MGQGFIHNDYDPTNGNSYWVKAEQQTVDIGKLNNDIFTLTENHYSETTTEESFSTIFGNMTLKSKKTYSGEYIEENASYTLTIDLNNENICTLDITNSKYFFYKLDQDKYISGMAGTAQTNGYMLCSQTKSLLPLYQYPPEILISSNPDEYEENTSQSGDYIKKIF